MTPDVVVDVGNSRIKFGCCALPEPHPDRWVRDSAALPPDDRDGWAATVAGWLGDAPGRWAVAGVHPERVTAVAGWVTARGGQLLVIDRHDQIPLPVAVDEPARVGIDRLLGAYAATRRAPPGEPVVSVDVGTAVTLNYVDAAGTFRGGAILPGPQLMARALHQHTAKLPPVVPGFVLRDDFIGRNTDAAIRIGIQSAVFGAVDHFLTVLAYDLGQKLNVYVTGGGAVFLRGLHEASYLADFGMPHRLVLDGIRLAAEALP